MSNNGWGACAACHPNRPHRQRRLDFPGRAAARPFRSTPISPSAIPSARSSSTGRPCAMKKKTSSSNIRAVSGGQGLIVLPGTSTQDTQVFNLRPLASGDRNQLQVRGVNAWDAIEKFVQLGIRTPISPLPPTDPVVQQGRALFISAGCQSCHGGPQWTSSRLTYIPPPSPARIVEGQIFNQLRIVGTFDPTDFNEVKNTGAPAEGDNGFVPASLLGLHAFPADVPPRRRGDIARSVSWRTRRIAAPARGGVDTLGAKAKRDKVIKFLLSIDANTPDDPMRPAMTRVTSIRFGKGQDHETTVRRSPRSSRRSAWVGRCGGCGHHSVRDAASRWRAIRPGFDR